MQDLATVNQISFFIAIKIKRSPQIYVDFFSKIFKLINILLTLPLGTSAVKWSFCQMDMASKQN